jgi:hypothetical protein
MNKLKEAKAGDLKTAKNNYGEGASIANVQNQTFNSIYVRGVARDAKLVGALFGAPVGEVTGPVKGTAGCYLVQVQERKEPEAPSEDRIQQQVQQLRQTQQSQYQRLLNQAAREVMNIKDWRYNANY